MAQVVTRKMSVMGSVGEVKTECVTSRHDGDQTFVWRRQRSQTSYVKMSLGVFGNLAAVGRIERPLNRMEIFVDGFLCEWFLPTMVALFRQLMVTAPYRTHELQRPVYHCNNWPMCVDNNLIPLTPACRPIDWSDVRFDFLLNFLAS